MTQTGPVISIGQAGSSPHADVVVGVDGSPPSIEALAWALRLARRRSWSLEVVTAWPDADSVMVHDVPGHFSAPRHRAFEAQDSALARARATAGPGPPVGTVIVNAHPVEALASRAAGARVLVVGSHGGGPTAERHHDRASVSDSVAALVRCPVVVVHDAGAIPTRSRPPNAERPHAPGSRRLPGSVRDPSATRHRIHTLRRP